MVGNCDEFYVWFIVVLVVWFVFDIGVMVGCDFCFGGIWVGIGQNGWMVVVINVCDLLVCQIGFLCGVLVVDFLCGSVLVVVFVDVLVFDVFVFVLFNLLLVDCDSCQFLGNYFLL